MPALCPFEPGQHHEIDTNSKQVKHGDDEQIAIRADDRTADSTAVTMKVNSHHGDERDQKIEHPGAVTQPEPGLLVCRRSGRAWRAHSGAGRGDHGRTFAAARTLLPRRARQRSRLAAPLLPRGLSAGSRRALSAARRALRNCMNRVACRRTATAAPVAARWRAFPHCGQNFDRSLNCFPQYGQNLVITKLRPEGRVRVCNVADRSRLPRP